MLKIKDGIVLLLGTGCGLPNLCFMLPREVAAGILCLCDRAGKDEMLLVLKNPNRQAKINEDFHFVVSVHTLPMLWKEFEAVLGELGLWRLKV